MGLGITQLCNMALDALGTRSEISDIGERSDEGRACNLHFDQVRDELLRMHSWNFANRTVYLADLGSSDPEWAYRYAYPDKCAYFRNIWQPVKTGQRIPYKLAGDIDGQGNEIRVIFSNYAQARGIYTMTVANTTLWDGSFCKAFYDRLAARICYRLTGDLSKQQLQEKIAKQSYLDAAALDANESNEDYDTVPEGLRVRGISSMGED
jgi:hypothetical protein